MYKAVQGCVLLGSEEVTLKCVLQMYRHQVGHIAELMWYASVVGSQCFRVTVSDVV